MTELLSKDHTILERPFMEFPPFGVDERGAKIDDVSGVPVLANVDYLQESVTRTAGVEAGERAVQELCRLLNERLRDPAYHVTPEILRNKWNSYGAEFVAFLREFCVILSEDPGFSFKTGRKHHLSLMIRILALPFTLEQIYGMIPYFSDKYARGSLTETVRVSAPSAIIRRKFKDRTNQQYGPYRKRCAELICQAFKGTLIATPERVHGLQPATVRDRTCIVNGDEWCEWEVTWTDSTWWRRLWLAWKSLRSKASAGSGKGRPAPAIPAAESRRPSSPRDEPALLSKDHTILERPFMEFPPFGVDEFGGKILDISGDVIKANIDQLEAHVAQTKGRDAAAKSIEDLSRLLNERIRDEVHHVTPDFLKDARHSYSAEFLCFLREFCVMLSGDPKFSFNAGREKHIAPWLQTVARPFSVRQIYRLYPYFSEMFAKGSSLYEVGEVTDRSAILRRKFADWTYQQFGPYRRRCAELGCQAVKGVLVAAPERVHRLAPATVMDRTCIANGDEWCEWEITWVPQPRRHGMEPAWGVLAGGALFAYFRFFYPAMNSWEALGIALFVIAVTWLTGKTQESLTKQQAKFLEDRHEELREAYLEQGQTQVELRRSIHEKTVLLRQNEELNIGLEAKVRERTAELERLNEALKAANEQLQELDHLKSEFFANISHEFRTPLTLSLASFRELWKLSPATKVREQINVGMRNTSRLLFLVNEFMDLAKFDQGVLVTKKLSIDFAALVRAVASNFESAERRRIHVRGVDKPVPLEADPHQIKKVLYNLLSNAFKFSDPDTGQVWIRLGSKGDRVEFEVEDNGIGIPRDQLGRIFERFAQVERRETRRQEGTGIGLALVKEIITQHGGTITVESELGRGSTFVISLPRGAANVHAMVAVEDDNAMAVLLSDYQPPLEREPPVVATRKVGGHRPIVLVADDNADMRDYIERLLKTQYEVVLARDGIEALEQAQQQPPDLILTDVMMPRMCGNALLKAVRADEKLCATPVVFLTARAGSEARVESLDTGANDYIAKPFDENEFLARVGNLIRQHAQERELIELQREKMTQFMPTQLADVIFSDRADDVLKSHRAEITVVFIDLRGFTAFAETGEPEDVMAVLQEYQSAMGRLIADHHGVIERFSGDAIMIFFNDPVPVPNHAEQAVHLALAMRGEVVRLRPKWAQRGIDLGAGIGVATGYATLGLVGFEQRRDYAAIGAVTNLAARLCGEARHGQILISERVRHFVKDVVHTESVGALTLKGFHKPVQAYNVAGMAPSGPPVMEAKAKKKKRG